MRPFKHLPTRDLIIITLSLSFFIAIFFIERLFMSNFDENDHLAAAYLMTQGRLLYRDIFSHHFPLPYYLTYLFTPLWSPNSPSQTATVFRLSVLFVYLISYFLVVIGFKSSRSRLSFSFWIVLLSLFFTQYHGNLVLSETYSAIFISAISWIVLPQIINWEKTSSYLLSLLCLFLTAAIWTQPLLVVLLPLPFLLSPKNRRQVLILLIILNSLPLFLLSINHQLRDFIQQGIVFNFKVYPNFFVDDLPPGNKFFQTILYFLRNEVFLSTHLGSSYQLFQFILHLSFYLFLLLVFKTKNRRHLIALLLIFLSTRIREVKIIPGQPFNFGIYPFLCLASISFSLVLNYFFKSRLLFSFILFIFILPPLFTNFWPIFKNSLDPAYNYHVFWSYRQKRADLIDNLTQPEDKILVYPHDVDLYALSRRQPPNRFLYWFPWIDSVDQYRQERLQALGSNNIPVIYLGNLDYKEASNYYLQYFPSLVADYTPIIQDGANSGVWLSNNSSNRPPPP
jgi:hypothetical protein